MARPLGIGRDIIRLRQKGYTYNQIKDALGCAKSTVQYHCEKQGLSDIGYNRGKISEKVQKQIWDDLQSGMTNDQVAEKHMVHVATVKRYKYKFQKQKPDDTNV